MEKLTLKGTRFVNESGKEVILHGLNVLQRQRENNHFYPGFEKAFGYFRRSGFNLLRFGTSGTARSRSRGRWIWSISGK